MKFDFISDLHVEHNQAWNDNPSYDGVSAIYPWHLEAKSDILIIGGDCSNDPFITLGVIEEARPFYKHVIFTDGNHEHYIGYSNSLATVGLNTDFFLKYAEDQDNVTFLNGETSYRNGSTLFVGANGWYDWTSHGWTSRNQQHQAWKRDSNDSRCIRYDEDGYPDKLARRQAEQLRNIVAEAQLDDTIEEIVITTHTIPHRKGMLPDNHRWGYLNGSYHNTLMDMVWMADEVNKIKFWGFGHTHFHHDFVEHGIRFVNNSRG